MSYDIEVTPDDLTRASGAVAASAARLSALVEDLAGYLAPMSSTWTGSAAAAYSAVQSSWNECAATITEMEQTMADGLRVIATNYVETETSVVSMWSS